ncbi:hypothetical protein [Mycobacterium asiaticum]|uniref:hypothetical protein n=1 Tax=Mycobacterium asiaticum TaxID=1790 RepID=UPI000AD34513|nr:hypothetical protein [Mycobacterium asiaticum]
MTRVKRPRQGRRVPAVFLAAVATVFAAGAVLFGFTFYDRYWRWRDCFNELGRCYDPENQNVYLEQAGVVWGGLTGVCVVCVVIAAPLAWLSMRSPADFSNRLLK